MSLWIKFQIHAKNLVRADRVTLFLADWKKNQLYSSIKDIGNLKETVFAEDLDNAIRISVNEGIAGYVAKTGESIRVDDVSGDPRFCDRFDVTCGYKTKSLLAVPIFGGKVILGVVELLNKEEGSFTEDDEQIFKMYSVYCGLALNIAKVSCNHICLLYI
ncbi:unnamed protein product [Trichobilharzia regenti]|nr:unnamed protein product [Trichobilharzia regenti]